jgi:hypothetical protein
VGGRQVIELVAEIPVLVADQHVQEEFSGGDIQQQGGAGAKPSAGGNSPSHCVLKPSTKYFFSGRGICFISIISKWKITQVTWDIIRGESFEKALKIGINLALLTTRTSVL